MKIPNGMTEQEVIDQINIVINRISPRYLFDCYGLEDIKQEAFIICMDALNRYDNKRPLENFLSVHLSNRLKNFVRDNYYTKDEEAKKLVRRPKQLSSNDIISYKEDYENKIHAKHIKHIVDSKLPHHYRADYLKMINDIYVPKKRKQEIISYIKDMIQDEEG